MLKRMMVVCMLVMLLAACGEGGSSMRGTTQRCLGSTGTGYTCTGSINQIVGEPTVSLGSDALAFSNYAVAITVEVEEGTVIASFTDNQTLEAIEATASPGSPAELSGDPRMFDGEMVLGFEAQGEERTASGISYEVVFTER